MAIDREKLLQVAGKLADKKKYDKAIIEYRKIVQHDPHDARTLLKIGDLQSRQTDYASAIATYDRVASHYASQGFQLKAIAVFKQIRELIRNHAPDLAARYSHITPRLADIYAELNLVTDALVAYDEVATMYQRAGRDRDAIVVFEKTVTLDPQNPLPHLRLAEARCRVKDLDLAIHSFWTASELLLGLRRPDDALKVIERILHFKQDPVYARAAAQLYLQRATPQAGMQALARLQLAFQANPKDLDTLALLAQAFDVINQAEKALEVHLEMARLARDQGNTVLWGQIIAHLRQVAPDNAQLAVLEKAGAPVPSIPAPPHQPPSAAPPHLPSIQSQGAHSQRTFSSMPPEIEVSTDEDAIDLDADVEYIDDEIDDPSRTSVLPESMRVDSASPETYQAVSQQFNSVLPASRPPAVNNPPLGDRPSDPGVVDTYVDVEFGTSSGADNSEEENEAFSQSAPHAASQSVVHQALSSAEAYRAQGNLDKAVETLHVVLSSDPNSIIVREQLREILVEANEREGAIQETLNIAIIHIHNRSPDKAEPLAHEILAIEPGHTDALNILEHVAALREVQETSTDRESIPALGVQSIPPSQGIHHIPAAPSIPHFEVPEEFIEAEPDDEPEPEAQPSTKLSRPSPDAIEEVLEEAEFFAAQGLHSDAEAILQDMLLSAPDHILLNEQLAEIQAVLQRQVSTPGQDATPESLDDKSFDIAASLDALDDLEEPNVAPQLTSPEEEVDVDLVFAKFKEGVKAVVDDDDAATHYDLGLAYKEMGLSADACSEFEIASADPTRTCMCFAMIGLIQREQGDTSQAQESLLKALATETKTAEQEIGIEYDLALLFEQTGDMPKYVNYLRSVAKRSPKYRDVEARIKTLGDDFPVSARGDDDEFDAAFDNLF